MNRSVLSLVLCFLVLGMLSSPAKSITVMFGTDENFLHVADTKIPAYSSYAPSYSPSASGSSNDIIIASLLRSRSRTEIGKYQLGIKTIRKAFLLPYVIRTDGYVLYQGNSYMPIDDEEIKSYQRSGLIPEELPDVSLGIFDYLFGYSLEILIVFLIGTQILKHTAKTRTEKIEEEAEGEAEIPK